MAVKWSFDMTEGEKQSLRNHSNYCMIDGHTVFYNTVARKP